MSCIRQATEEVRRPGSLGHATVELPGLLWPLDTRLVLRVRVKTGCDQRVNGLDSPVKAVLGQDWQACHQSVIGFVPNLLLALWW